MDRESAEWKLGEQAQEAWERWLTENGWAFNRLSAIDDGRGAPMTDGARTVVLPDLEAARGGRRCHLESKGKTGPTPLHVAGLWRHGIDQRLLEDYRTFEQLWSTDILLAIWERNTDNGFPPGTLLCGWLGELEWHPGFAGHERYYGGKVMMYVNRDDLRAPEVVIGRAPPRQLGLFPP